MGKYRKFPRIKNLPWSKSESSDDVWIDSTTFFLGKEVVCQAKLDGQNTTFYNDINHARSIDSMRSHHPARSYVKQLHSSVKHLIPENVRICGEDVYAKHSIYYPNLTAYFYVFAVFENSICLSWDDTVKWTKVLGLEHVPVLYRGIWNENLIKTCWPNKCFGEEVGEGYVVRVTESFDEKYFCDNIGKMVRPRHVQTDVHWSKNWKPNKLGWQNHANVR